jgi:two-component system, LytTR family, sensor kinase
MKPGIPIKKIVRTALYTSLILIVVLAITPHTIVFRSFSFRGLFDGMIFISAFILFIWVINILLVFFAEKNPPSKKWSYLRYGLSFLLCVPGILLVNFMITGAFHGNGKTSYHLYAMFVLGFIINTIVLIIQDLILLRDKKSRIESENAALKVKNVEATNQQLKQQIHPHFLFNSLNTLKTLIKKNPDLAEDYLVKLSDFLRASLLSNNPNVVRLSDELKLCYDFLDMQKIRFGNAFNFRIQIPADVQASAFVPVFSLLPLLENAIKHNQLTNEFPLGIDISYDDGRIIVSNNMQAKYHTETSTGLGLENLAERYRILCGDEIVIKNDGRTFSVSINTFADENSTYRR